MTRDELLEVGTNQFELLEFSIFERRADGRVYEGLYGLNVYKVKQVVPWPEVQPMPDAPPDVLGGFDHRGTIVPLVDLRRFLGVLPAPDTMERLVIISEFNQVKVGLAINTANRIHRLAWTDVRTPPDAQRDTIYRGMVGVVVQGTTMIRILNVEEILAHIGLGDRAYLEKNALFLPPPPGGAPVPAREPVDPAASDDRTLILVVDDSTVMRGMLTKLCEAGGYRALACKDGHDAWIKIQQFLIEARKQNRPLTELLPLGIFDIEMPRMDGFTLTRNVKTNPETAGIKVILHTSLAGPQNVEKGKRMGADDFAVKFDGPALLLQIRRLLG